MFTLGQDTCKKLQGSNYFCIFYSFELKLGRMVELCIPKILRFLFFDFNGFWRENDVTRLTAKLKFQGMAKQINNFERTWRDRNKCEKFFSKTQSVGELLSFNFWISRHFVTIFRNIRTFQDAISPKPIELFQVWAQTNEKCKSSYYLAAFCMCPGPAWFMNGKIKGLINRWYTIGYQLFEHSTNFYWYLL